MPQPRSSTGWLVVVLAVILWLPAIYVLSIGPAYIIAIETGLLDDPSFDRIYAPVIWAINNNETVSAVIDSYIVFCLRVGGYDT